MGGKPHNIMATLEDIIIYDNMNLSDIISFDLDAIETFQSIQDDYNEGLRY